MSTLNVVESIFITALEKETPDRLFEKPGRL